VTGCPNGHPVTIFLGENKMFPAIFMTILVGGFGIYKYVTLYKETVILRDENAKMKDELFALKFVPRDYE